MKYNTKGLIFKLAMTFGVMCAVMLFIVNVNSAEWYIMWFSVAVNAVVCILTYISMRNHKGD